MSVIAVQAGVANHVLDDRPELARPALSVVESTARSALVEMRRLLGVLRQPEESSTQATSTPGRAPTPGMAGLPALIAQFEQAGLTVRLSMHGESQELPDGIDLSTYRIVQEGLTNVLRHGGTVAALTLTCGAKGSTIDIRDDGRDGAATSHQPEPGHGLIGIRERVVVFKGEFAAGPLPGGGFRLWATLPAGVGP
jgi:signal transduction histidine kinase